jgi:hypothetical protein
VKHKDPKKGHQNHFRAFCLCAISEEVDFPDTSNTQYQSHAKAATEIIHHLQLYLDFLRDVGDGKEKRGMNHMEMNIFKGLTDTATLTELAVLCLYCQAISIPFSESIRNPSLESQNALDLAPFYDQIITYLGDLIKNPDLLLGPNISPEVSSFNSQPWKNPEAVNVVRNNQHLYPHLKPLLTAFSSGALETWKRFTKELGPGSKISTLTSEERYLAFRHPTNDLNEGSLGLLRLTYRSFPNITLRSLNSRLMIKFALFSP